MNGRFEAILIAIAALVLAGCTHHGRHPSGPCQDGSSRCAAASAPKGMRSFYRGQRMIKPQWMETTNRESGAADIGVKAQWQPFSESR